MKAKGHEQVGYSLPSTMTKRGAGFGHGKRKSFVDQWGTHQLLFVDAKVKRSKYRLLRLGI